MPDYDIKSATPKTNRPARVPSTKPTGSGGQQGSVNPPTTGQGGGNRPPKPTK